MKKAVLVVGNYRSGTSAMMGALERLGIPPCLKSMLSNHENNPHGMYEDEEITSINEALLHASKLDDETLGPMRSYVEKAMEREIWGAKDPRFCATVFHWVKAIVERGGKVHLVCMRRNLDLVVRSMLIIHDRACRREAGRPQTPREALQRYVDAAQFEFWRVANLASLVDLKVPHEARWIEYDRLVERPQETITRIIHWLGITPDDDQRRRAFNWIDSGKRHHQIGATA